MGLLFLHQAVEGEVREQNTVDGKVILVDGVIGKGYVHIGLVQGRFQRIADLIS